MVDKTKVHLCERLLRLKHTGRLIALINTAIYSAVSYFAVSWLKTMIGSKDGTDQSIGIILLFLVMGALVWFRDLITDTIDMQSSANKERDEHKKTKEKCDQLEKELIHSKVIIHAIKSNMTNTMLKEPTDADKISKINTLIIKMNNDLSVNNIIEPPVGIIQKDYLSLLNPDIL